MPFNFEIDDTLNQQLKVKSLELGVTEKELINRYIIQGLKNDKTKPNYENVLNINKKRKSNKFEIPDMLKIDLNKEDKPITEEKFDLEMDNPDGEDIFEDIIGIVHSPTKTDSVALKKETYDRG